MIMEVSLRRGEEDRGQTPDVSGRQSVAGNANS